MIEGYKYVLYRGILVIWMQHGEGQKCHSALIV